MMSDDELKTPPAWAKNDVRGMYLFGSRSMALRKAYRGIDGDVFDTKMIRENLSPYTDFDYAAPYSDDLKNRLMNNGWTWVDVNDGIYHPCKLMKGLLVKSDGQKTVQILLRKNHVLFTKTWDAIDPWYYYHYIWKSSPNFLYKDLPRREMKKRISETIGAMYEVVNKTYGFQVEM